MKYIRTKSFIYDSKDVVVVNENGTLVVLRGIDKDFVERTHGRTWNTGTNVVLAQADTIEELCDVFIKKSNESDNPYFNIGISANVVFDKKYEEFKTEFEHYDYYGAIWTEKGLIYVAKMNEEGKLCLI